MHLSHTTYGKARIRIMRVKRDLPRHEVRELDIEIMLEGDFAASFLSADNTKSIATDSIKNIVNVTARQYPALDTEDFLRAVAAYFFEHYDQIEKLDITASETKWTRLIIDGAPHDHAFQLDANGKGVTHLTATRSAQTISSGVTNFTFLKTTQSGWVGYVMDEVTTLPETTDRIFSTAMNASWTWNANPKNFPETNGQILEAMLHVFATTCSTSVQNSLYQMGTAALQIAPEISSITLACPNKHYIPLNLSPFKLDNPNIVFLPTDDPHGQIECTVTR